MKKVFVFCLFLVLIPAVCLASSGSGKAYQVTFDSEILGKYIAEDEADTYEAGSVAGIVVFSAESFQSGVISIEYANENGDIGTGSFASTGRFDMSGTFDLYDSKGDYYLATFTALTTRFFIVGTLTITDPKDGATAEGTFRGRSTDLE